MLQHPAYCLGIKQVTVVFECALQAGVKIPQLKGQIEFRTRKFCYGKWQQLTGSEFQGRERGILQNKCCLEQWRAVSMAFPGKLFDKFFERDVLMGIGLQSCFLHSL